MIASRRRFLFGAGATAATLVAAPAIVRVAANLMPVKPYVSDFGGLSFSDLVTTTLRNRGDLIANQIMKNNAILRYMAENRQISIDGVPYRILGSVSYDSPTADWLEDRRPTPT